MRTSTAWALMGLLLQSGCPGQNDAATPAPPATLAPVTGGGAAPVNLPIEALRLACATAPACAQSWVDVWRGPAGSVGALALDNRGCGHHMPTVWFDGAGQQTFVAAEFPYMPSAPADDPSRMRAEAQQARMAELTSGLVQTEQVRCSPLGEVIRTGPPR